MCLLIKWVQLASVTFHKPVVLVLLFCKFDMNLELESVCVVKSDHCFFQPSL